MFVVVRLNQPHAVKYGLCLNMDEKYRSLKKQLSVLCGVPASRLLLVEVYGTLVRVSHSCLLSVSGGHFDSLQVTFMPD